VHFTTFCLKVSVVISTRKQDSFCRQLVFSNYLILSIETYIDGLIILDMGPDPTQPEHTFDLQQIRGWPAFDTGTF